MTTTVIVKAHAWDVKVTRISDNDGQEIFPDSVSPVTIVKIGQEMAFHVWQGSDILIHEIQPTE